MVNFLGPFLSVTVMLRFGRVGAGNSIFCVRFYFFPPRLQHVSTFLAFIGSFLSRPPSSFPAIAGRAALLWVGPVVVALVVARRNESFPRNALKLCQRGKKARNPKSIRRGDESRVK